MILYFKDFFFKKKKIADIYFIYIIVCMNFNLN